MVIIWCHAIQLLAWHQRLTIEPEFNGHYCDVMLFSSWHQNWPLNSVQWSIYDGSYSLTGHQDCHLTHWRVNYMMPCYYRITGHQDCHWTEFNGQYWCQAIQLAGHKVCHWMSSMVIIDVMLLSNWSSRLSLNSFNGQLYDVMLFSNWSSRLSLNSGSMGHLMMPCYAITWSSRLPLNSIQWQYMMSWISVTGHKDCHWTHSMVIMWCHATAVTGHQDCPLNSFNGHYMMSCYSVTGHQDFHWTWVQWSLHVVMLFSEYLSSKLPLNQFNDNQYSYWIAYSLTGHWMIVNEILMGQLYECHAIQ